MKNATPMFPSVIKSDNSPDWWKGYDKTKHSLPDGIVEGNLGNTLNALAGFCALHHIAYYTENVQEHTDQLLLKENWHVTPMQTSGSPSYYIPQTFRNSVGVFFPLSKYHGMYVGAPL